MKAFLLFALFTGLVGADTSVCLLSADPGPCTAYFPSFWFNVGTGTCEEFIYGGCGGNGNRFNTFGECMTECSGGPGLSVCSLPIETGPCLAYIPSYGYNVNSGACEGFVYGGCGGNENKFDNLAACQNTCGGGGPGTPVCSIPSDPGPCYGYFPKFWYNADIGACDQFIYGGCGGNDNRFDSFWDCMDACHETTRMLSPKEDPAEEHRDEERGLMGLKRELIEALKERLAKAKNKERHFPPGDGK